MTRSGDAAHFWLPDVTPWPVMRCRSTEQHQAHAWVADGMVRLTCPGAEAPPADDSWIEMDRA